MQLKVTHYESTTQWRWELADDQGNHLGDHKVSLDTAAAEYRGYMDPPGYLRALRDAHGGGRTGDEELLCRLGDWIGQHVFGPLRDKIRANFTQPATIIHVLVPPEAQDLLFRPFELAHLGTGDKPLVEHGVRFIYQHPDAPADPAPKRRGDVLRVLTVFSLPTDANPLNLRRERHELKKLLLSLARTRGVAIEVRVLQYGATRATLRDSLREGQGWDIVHFSCHGGQGVLLLEDEQGGTDEITADDLKDLLLPAKDRLHLLVLSACWSGAASHQAAREMLGLGEADGPKRSEETGESTTFPSLGQDLAHELDCAVLAMRFPVGDRFATDLALSLYGHMLKRGQPLPAALKLALEDSTTGERSRFAPSLSSVTPILFGPRAAALELSAPPRPADFELLRTGLFGFPPEPEHFVGRLMPMLRASQAFAIGSAFRGVLFYGMAGGGKTACALELAYRYEPQGDLPQRFQGFVFHKCPDEGAEVDTALFDCLHDIESQLNITDGRLTAVVDQPEAFSERLLPRLRQMLTQQSVLIVLDNIEGLLTSSGDWRDDKWGAFLEALLTHEGDSRLVLTSRRPPNSLVACDSLSRESIHALSFAESVLLAREFEHLRKYFGTEDDLALLTTALGVIQGHPELLRQADRLAADREQFRRQVERTKEEAAKRDAPLQAFFDTGESEQEDEDYVATLSNWTAALTSLLAPTARLLFHFLCRFEDEDRVSNIIEANWKDVLTRLKDDIPEAAQALSEPGQGLAKSLARLVECGLIGARDIQVEDETVTLYTIHPGVAEAGRAAADADLLAATDCELGDFHVAVYQQGLKTEMEGGGRLIVHAARRSVPYLLRSKRWRQAGVLLEQIITRDETPATLNWVIPLLCRLAGVLRGTELEAHALLRLAKAFRMACRLHDSQDILREVIATAEPAGHFRDVLVASGDLVLVLLKMGRPEEGLAAVDRMIELSRRAGLGPWTLLGAEGQRLHVLNAMGRWDEVLAAVEGHRERLRTLPEKSAEDELVTPWNARESMLNAGGQAAMRLERWEASLSLNNDIVESKSKRGVGEVEIARTLFNNCGPLLGLGRFDEAGKALETCRDVFEGARDYARVGKTYASMVELEARQGHCDTAVLLAKLGLKYGYRSGDPEDCAASHHNLATSLVGAGDRVESWLPHYLAAALISCQTDSGELRRTLRDVARLSLPEVVPSFDEVADGVEQIEGARFRELFASLPQRAPDGDAALAEIWEMALQARAEADEQRSRREAVLSSLPPAVRKAFEFKGQKLSDALKAAIEQLPADQRERTLDKLREIGVRDRSPDKAAILHQFEPIIRDVVALVNVEADAETRARIEEALPKLEEQGWHLSAAIQRIFSGDREPEALTANLDDQDTLIVRHILELL